MSTIRGVKDRRFKFVQLLNSMFEDPNLSLKAKGFIGFCLTKKENWDFHISHLCTVLKEGEDAIYSTIKECISLGYAYRYRARESNGQLSEVEFIISDSKEEIEQIQKERDPTNEFKKSLPHRGFPDVVKLDKPLREKPRRENPDVVSLGKIDPIYSNTNSSNTEEQQQGGTAAVPLKHKEKKQQPQITAKLHGVNIPLTDKMEIAGAYDAKIIDNAIDWATDPKNPPKKCLAASIKFACARKLVKPLPKENQEEKNKFYAMRYDKMENSTSRVDVYSTYVEVSNCGVNGSTAIKYSEKGFFDQFTNALRKNNFRILDDK